MQVTQYWAQATHNIICNEYTAIGVGRTYQVQPPHGIASDTDCPSGSVFVHVIPAPLVWGFIDDRAEVDVSIPQPPAAAVVAPASLQRRYAFGWHLSRRKATHHHHTCYLQRGFWITLGIWGLVDNSYRLADAEGLG